jgi:hypothetical protein
MLLNLPSPALSFTAANPGSGHPVSPGSLSKEHLPGQISFNKAKKPVWPMGIFVFPGNPSLTRF